MLSVHKHSGKSTPLPQLDDCQDCGVCCLHMGYPPYIEGSATQTAEQYWTDLPDHLRTELVEYRNQYQHPTNGELDGPCFWFDTRTKLCKNHKYRPSVCRDFKVGCKDCVGWRDHYGIKTRAANPA